MYEGFSVMLGESFRHAVEDFRRNSTWLLNDASFRSGCLMAFHRVFTLIEQAADTNDIPLEALGLGGLTEQDFLE